MLSKILKVLVCIILPNLICAQSLLDSVQYLEEVSISRNNLRREIIPVQTLSGSDLQKLNANSVADAIRYFSGVQLKDYGGIGGLKTIDVRSMGSQHVGVFYEGIKIENAQNGVVDLGRFSLDNMEAISLYNGQKSAILQSAKDYTSASSVYLTAKTPKFTSKKYNIKAAFKTGSFHLANPTILWEQKISKNISSSFNADFLYTSGEYKFTYKVNNNANEKSGYDTTATRKNGDVQFLRLEHALFGKIKNGEWRTRAYYYDSKRGYPGAVVREEAGRFKHEDRQWDRNFFIQGQIKKHFTDLYTSQLSAKYSHDYLHYASDTLAPIRVRNTFKLNEVYVSSANVLSISPIWSVNISADFQLDKLDANLTEFIFPSRYSTLLAVATSVHLPKIKIQASLLTSLIHDKMEEEKLVKKNWDEYTPSLIASWKPWTYHNFNLRAFYKKVFRMPTFNEIYYSFIGNGNSNLRPEYATQYNVGASYAKQINSVLKKIEMQADAYYNKITDKILATPGGANYRWTMENKGLVKIKGLDLSLIANWDFMKDWDFNTRFSYTYQKAQNYTDPSDDINYKGQLNYIPWHSGSAIIGTTYKTWGLNYSFIYTGERYSQTANIPANKVLAWYTSDVSINKSFECKAKTLKIAAEVNNMFNQHYDVIDRYPMPGTNFRLTLRIEL